MKSLYESPILTVMEPQKIVLAELSNELDLDNDMDVG